MAVSPMFFFAVMAAVCAGIGGWRACARLCKKVRCPAGTWAAGVTQKDDWIFIGSGIMTVALGSVALVFASAFLCLSTIIIGFLIGGNIGAQQARMDESEYEAEIRAATAARTAADSAAVATYGAPTSEGPSFMLKDAQERSRLEFESKQSEALKRLYRR